MAVKPPKRYSVYSETIFDMYHDEWKYIVHCVCQSRMCIHCVSSGRVSIVCVQDVYPLCVFRTCIHCVCSGRVSIVCVQDEYTWRIDLAKTEPFWRGWFSGLTKLFLSCPIPKMLILAGEKHANISNMGIYAQL